MPVPGDILNDTVLTRLAGSGPEASFGATIPDAWKVFYAFGGVTMATALRAAEAALDRPDLRTVAASATFVSPVPCGPVICDVDVLRAGKRAAQALVSLREEPSDVVGIALSVTLAREAEDWEPVTFTDLDFPEDVLPPAECAERPEPPDDAPFPRVPFHEQIETKPVVGNVSWDDDWEAGAARAVSWMSFRNPANVAGGPWPVWTLAVPADSLGWALSQRVGPGADPFLVLSLQIDLHVFATPSSRWLLQDVRAHHAAGGCATGSVDVWDEEQRLIARATQTAMLRPLAP
jgi:acyl-CoA thioesterase